MQISYSVQPEKNFPNNCPSKYSAYCTGTQKSPIKNHWSWVSVIDSTGKPPCPRSLHIGVVLPPCLYIFGGYDGSQRTNDFYRFNFLQNVWLQIQSPLDKSQPSPRDRHTAVIYDKCLYIFGGYDGLNRVNDFYEFNTETNQWTEIVPSLLNNPPTPRHSHSAVVYNGSMYVFAGYDGLYKNDFHKYNFTTKTWNMIKDSNPSAENWPKPRYRTSCVVFKDKMFMFGGHDGTRQLNDFYFFDFNHEIWTQINHTEVMPSPRDSHIAIVYNWSLFIFGGSTGAQTSSKNNFFEYKMDEQKWYQVHSNNNVYPPARFCHVGAVFQNSLFIFGGYDGTNRLNDFFQFRFEPDTAEIPEVTRTEEL